MGLNAKARKRIRNSERRDYYRILHREYDTRTAAKAVKQSILIALGNDGLAMMSGTVY